MFSFKRLFRRKAAGAPKPQSVSNVPVPVPVPASVSAPAPSSTSITPARKSLAKRIGKTLKKAWARVIEFLLEDVPVSYPGMINDPLAHQTRLQYQAQLAAKKAKAKAAVKQDSPAIRVNIVQLAQTAVPVQQPLNKNCSEFPVLPYKAVNLDIGRLFLERLFVDLPMPMQEYEDFNLNLLFTDCELDANIYKDLHLDTLFEEPDEPKHHQLISRALSADNIIMLLHHYAQSSTTLEISNFHRCASSDFISVLS